MSIEVKEISQEEAEFIKNTEEGHYADVKSKRIKPSKLSVTVSSFANSSAGEIFVGIEEDDKNGVKNREWDGFDDVEEANGLIQTIEEMSPLSNHFQAVFYRCENEKGLLLHLVINKTLDILKSTTGKIYRRKGAQNLPIDTPEKVEKLEYDKGINTFEDQPVNVDEKLISNSLVTINFMIEVVSMSEPKSWLETQMVIANNKPLVAGVLLFADSPQAILPKRSAIKIYRYSSKEEEGERGALVFDPITIEGHIYDLIENSKNKVKDIVEGIQKLGPKGLMTISYPEEALHEIITNAVLHRDYSVPKDIHIRIFDNRVEVESPGALPGQITLKNIMDDQSARNPKIIRLINKFPNPPKKDVGEGLKTAFEAMNKLRLRKPDIQELDNAVLVILKHEALASPEQIVMEYLDTHDEITNAIGRDLTGIKSENTMKDVFYRLRDRHDIEPVPGKAGRSSAWRIRPK